MWSWVLFWWIVLIVLAQLPAADVRVRPSDLTHAPLLLPAAIVAAIGVALSATSNSGRRRFILPAIASSVFAFLAQGDARAIATASGVAEEVRLELAAARTEHGEDAVLLWVEPAPVAGGVVNGIVDGHAVFPSDLAALLGDEPGGVHGLKIEAFQALVADSGWDSFRADGVFVLGLGEGPAWIPPPADSGDIRLWRGEGRSPALDLETASIRSVRALARPGTPTDQPPQMRWLSEGGGDEPGVLEGAWVVDEEGLHAVFNVGKEPAWVTVGRVRQIWFGQGLALVVQAAAHDDAQELAGVGAPITDGVDWVFEVEQPTRVLTIQGGEGAFWLGLFDSTGLRYDELPCAREGGRVWAVGAAVSAARITTADGDLRWALEQRVKGVTVARSRQE